MFSNLKKTFLRNNNLALMPSNPYEWLPFYGGSPLQCKSKRRIQKLPTPPISPSIPNTDGATLPSHTPIPNIYRFSHPTPYTTW